METYEGLMGNWDESVILRLFDKYSISLPRRTKGSMRKRLKGLLFSKEQTFFRTVGENGSENVLPEFRIRLSAYPL